MSAFRVGQKVVCIINMIGVSGTDYRGLVSIPALHEVVTIREIMVLSGRAILFFAEHRNPVIHTKECRLSERGFCAAFFRPLAYPSQSLEHDVAQFLEISRQLPAPAKESA